MDGRNCLFVLKKSSRRVYCRGELAVVFCLLFYSSCFQVLIPTARMGMLTSVVGKWVESYLLQLWRQQLNLG